MKIKLRKSVAILLLVTVLAPIVLYTDTLGAYFNSSSSRNEFVEDVSTFTFAGEVGPLNVLPQESSTTLKEPLGIIYSEKLSKSSSDDSNASSSGNTRITRQLTGDSAEDGRGGNNQSMDRNLIRQVTDQGYEAASDVVEENKEIKSTGNIRRVGRNDVKKEISSLYLKDTSENHSEKMVLKTKRHSSGTTGKDISREQGKGRNVKGNGRQTLPADARVRQLKDQLIQGKVYLSLSSTRNKPQFSRELRLRMKEVQRALGDATKDSDLPRSAPQRLKAMELTLSKGRQIEGDCSAAIKKLRAMLHSAEEQLRVHKKQALFLTHLTARTIPKGLHCFPLRLSTEYFMLNSSQQHFSNEEKLENPNLYHYALFSDNVLAASVVVNSTITHVKDPLKHVFHVVTDRLNYAAMKMWFLSNPPGRATIQVQNVEEFTWLNLSYSPVLRQLGSPSMIDYYFKDHRRSESDSNMKYRNPKYLSIMNHLRFYLPEIFPKLDKVLFLDDDIVVQKDLTGLWSLDLKGKVIGVVETCGESFHRFDRYLNFSNPLISRNFSPRACGWAFGMNILALDEWRKQNITEVYHKWQNLNHDRLLWKLGTLPPGLITFWNQTYALEKSWHVLGLGYNPNVSQKDIERAAVIHYNGNLKPWLEIGIPKFRNYWAKYVDYGNQYLRECNISP